MTSLTILPNTDKKTLKLTGKVAAGEHVAVSVSGGADWIGEGKALRLRVLFGMKQVAMFPLVTEEDAAADTSGETVADAWAAGGEGDATCTLNLFTIPAEKYLKFGGNCLWVLDDIENNTLYGTGEMEVLPWPKRRGSDVPYALDEYPDIVAELKDAWEAYQTAVNASLASMDNTISLHAANTDIHVTAAKQTAWTAKYDKPVDGIPKAHLASAVQTSLGLADSAIQEHQDISGKADKATTYTKTEVDAIVQALKTGSRQIVETLPASGQPMVIYMVPKSASQTNNAYDEYIWTAAGAWEKIGDTEIDLSDYYTKTVANETFVAKEQGKGLSTNDYTTAEKQKLAGIAAGAQVNPMPIAPAIATESGMFADAYWTKQDLAGKADKVANATSGNLVAIGNDGNLVDSGNRVAGSFTAVSFIGGGSGLVGFELDSTDKWVELYIDLPGGFILKFPLHGDTLAVQEDIAPTFDETDVYDEGELVFHDGLYRCVNPNGHTGAWVAEDFAGATVEDVLAALRTALAGKADASSLAPVATSGNYDDLIDKPTIPTIPTPVAPASATASGQFADALATKSELAAKVALEEFSSGSWAQGSSYSSGDIVFYDGFLYLCSSDVSSSSTPPSEDPTHWDQVTVNYLMFLKADAATTLAGYGITDAHITNGVITLGAATITPLTSHQDISGKANNAAIATVFSDSATYAVGDVVMYEGTRYKCATAVTVAGAWTGSTNWTAESVQDVIGDVESALHTINYGAQS